MSNKIAQALNQDDNILDQTLRPGSFDEYIGQEKVKTNLGILIEAAKQRKDTLEHILIHGPSGLGKTTLAQIIAKEMGSNFKITSGTALEKVGDLGSILTNLSDSDIFFIDEVHRLNKLIEEVLYPAMENFKLDIVIGKGTSAKTLQIDLPKFTLIAATTRVSLLSSPFRSRFGANYRLDFYETADIKKILQRSAKILKINIDSNALNILAESSRYTPRIANRLLKRARDFAQVNKKEEINATLAGQTLKMLDIDDKGLESTDIKILKSVIDKFGGGPVGLKAIAASIAEEEETIEDVYEPYLMQIGFLTRTTRGRVATKLAFEHLGLKLDEDQQKTLI